MRIVSFNANGIRSIQRKAYFEDFAEQDIDVLCLQELKAKETQIEGSARPESYHHYMHCAERPGYSGVALYSRIEAQSIHKGLASIDHGDWNDIDNEGRWLQADYQNLSIISAYFPSGSSSEARQAFKMRFLKQLLPVLKRMLQENRSFILCGDLNIAHQEIDLKNWRGNRKNSGFLPEEREWMSQLLALGLCDVYRMLYPEQASYTWWSNRGKARLNDVGWRIDYQIATADIAACAQKAWVHQRQQRYSDHAPLVVDYDYQLR